MRTLLKDIHRSFRMLAKRPAFFAAAVLTLALGAQYGQVMRMVIADRIKPVLAGLALGILGVFDLSKVLASLVYGVSASDPATLAGVALIFISVSLAALYFPARRATKIDPLAILRTS